MLHKIKRSLLLAGVASFVALPAHAEMEKTGELSWQTESPVVISGKVADIHEDDFTLSYGPDKFVTVDMEDWDWFGEDPTLLELGDDVIISGVLNDELLTGQEIEADTVFLVSDSSYYYKDQATAAPLYMLSLNQPTEMGQATAEQLAGQEPAAGDMTVEKMKGSQSQISAMGMVTEVQDQGFKISSGDYDLSIDAAEIAEKASDIAIGDRVFVIGSLDQNFFDNHEIVASRVVELSQSEPAGDLNMMEDMSFGTEDMTDQTIAQ